MFDNWVASPVQYAAAKAAFTPAELFSQGQTGGWWDTYDPATLAQNSAGSTPATANDHPLGRMADKRGGGTFHFLQATDAARPLLKISGNRRWLETNGTSTFMRALFTMLAQPYDIILAVEQIAFANGGNILGGGNTNAGAIYQLNPEPSIRVWSSAGAGNLISNALPTGVMGIIVARFGTSGRLQINRGATVLANSGTTAPGGITIGANNSGAALARIKFGGMILRSAMSDSEIGRAVRWLAARNSISL